MKFFAVLPIWDYSSKRITINNEDHVEVGFIQRKYANVWDRLLHYSSLPFWQKVNLDGKYNDCVIEIKEHSFKANLLKMKWDVWTKDASSDGKYFLEDKTKISTNPRIIYTKNNKEYLFKQNLLDRICEVKVNNQVCAKIKIEKRIPISLKVIYEVEDNDLTVTELLGIYYIIKLIY